MRKYFIKWSVCILVLFLFGFTTYVSAAVEDYEGTYSGTYSGTDSGTWSAKLDSFGNGFAFAMSNVTDTPDVGFGTVDSSGNLVISLDGGATANATIDSAGDITGTWNNPTTGVSGTLGGSRNAFSDIQALSGKYSGAYSGTDSGTWSATIDSQGNLSSTSYSNVYDLQDSGSGIANSSGEFSAEMSGGAILYGIISSESDNIQGVWYNPYTDDGGTLTGSRVVESSDDDGGGGGGGGGCFIATSANGSRMTK